MASESGPSKVDTLPINGPENDPQPSPSSARKFAVETVPEDKEVDSRPEHSVRFREDESKPSAASAPTNDKTEQDAAEETPESPRSPDEMGTIGYATQEAIPMTVYYRNQGSHESGSGKQRPTLIALRKGFDELPEESEKASEEVSPSEAKDPEKGQTTTVTVERRIAGPKFGWVKGVLFSCLLNIWGVMLYLRLSWVVGQAGIELASVIILMSAVVTTLTTLSMSAICTNGEIKGGGSYYLISRSLGPEFGGAIGLIFSIASAVAVAMYVVGFSETLRDILKENGHSIVDDTNDIRIIGIVTLFFVLGVALVGMKWVVRAQVILLVILMISIIDVVIGSFIGPQNMKIENQGFTGYKSQIFETNFSPDYTGKESFFTVFAVFFPAATGILAGVNISGDLKNPGKAIPKGTFAAIIISTIVYLLLAWIAGSCVEREALGSLAVIGSSVLNVTNITTSSNETMKTCATTACKYGLLHDFQVMEMISGWGPIVTAGIFASTLSSALASIVGAPKTFQAVCKDELFPGIGYFGKGYGPGDEPRRGYILTFVVALAFIAIGKLNTIALIISNFFLIVYALINYSVFAASLGHSPGWRPSFKYYNMWVSLIGALLCVAIMFLISWWAALVTIIIVCGLYKYVDYKKPEVNWGSSAQAYTYISGLRYINRLESVEDHVKNFRPQCLVLTGRLSSRPNLACLVSHITRNVGLMVYGHVTLGEFAANSEEALIEDRKWLKAHKIKAFRAATTAPSLRAGVQSMLSLTGLGKMKPNTLVLGFKSDWQTAQDEMVDGYVNIVKDAFEMNYGVAILRVNEKLQMDGEDEDSLSSDEENEATNESKTKNEAETPLKAAEERSVPQPVANFQDKQRGTIDVWWLFDDGGLTVLLPYLLTRHRSWRSCKLRIFTADIVSKQSTIENKKLKMVNLLKKFRIDYDTIVSIEGINKRPSEESIEAFKKLPIKKELDEEEGLSDKKVLRNIRIGELVREHSHNARLIVMSLPVPVEGVTSSKMYMSWLEFLTMGLPPVLLVRGNQQSVLTFYS